MNPEQEKIAQWLSGRSPSLHEAYLAARQLLAGPATPGRAQMICHAGRDLCSGLQDLQSVSKKERADITPVLREIQTIWEKEGFDAADLVQTDATTLAAEQTASPEV